MGIAGWVSVSWGVDGGLLVLGYAAWRHGPGWVTDIAEWVPAG